MTISFRNVVMGFMILYTFIHREDAYMKIVIIILSTLMLTPRLGFGMGMTFNLPSKVVICIQYIAIIGLALSLFPRLASVMILLKLLLMFSKKSRMRQEELFKQPPQKEDCPICFLPLPPLQSGMRYQTCCGKIVCCGCIYANSTMNRKKNGLVLCPFCRTPTPDPKKSIEMSKQRMKAKDPEAIYGLGCLYEEGNLEEYPRDILMAVKLWRLAAKLGHTGAYYNIGAYYYGTDVKRYKKKGKFYFELAAIGGDIMARYALGCEEEEAGNTDKALRHYIIAARSGGSNSLKKIQKLYSNGHATKEDYSTALQSYQVHLKEIKSSQRDQAAADSDRFRYY